VNPYNPLEHSEGAFYLWTEEEIDELLEENRHFFSRHTMEWKKMETPCMIPKRVYRAQYPLPGQGSFRSSQKSKTE